MKINKFSTSIVAAFLTSVVGCSSGGGGSSAQERPLGSVAGKAVDAILVGSTVRAYEWKDGVKVPGVVAEATTDSEGYYAMSPQYQDTYFLLEATGGHYVEEATGTIVDLEEDQALTALVRYESGDSLTTHITIATHWAACQAEWRAQTQGNNDADAVDLSNDLFSTVVGVPIRETEPLNITDGNNASPTLTAGLQYGLFPAALSSLTKKMAEQSGQGAHTLKSTTTINLSQIGCNDIRADGKLDGQGFTPSAPDRISQLSFGTVQLSPEIYKNDLAQEMLAFAASPLNQTGLDTTAFFTVADSLSQMDSKLFNNIVPVSADITGPEVTLDLEEDTYVNNTVLFNFQITDPLGLKTVNFYVNNSFVDSGSAGDTALNVNTTGYTDGLYEVKVVVSDNADNTTTFTRNFNFSNTNPIVALTSSLLVNNQTYAATGTYQVNGSPITSITVNGIAAEIDAANNTWSASIPLLSGNNLVTMNIEDEIGNTGSNQRTVGVDLISPDVSANDTTITFTTYQGQLNLCTYGNLNQTSASSNPICISTDNVSLGGATINSGLTNDGFALLSYTPTDPQGAGVFTLTDDLVIEYRFEQDGVEKVAWSPVPVSDSWGANYYFPLVSEYLGEDWYQIGNTVNNHIQIRTTDLAGNTVLSDWNFLVDVLIPAITVDTETTNIALFTGASFNTRTAIEGQLVNVEYVLTNPSSSAYYISMDDAQAHSVAHTYETKVRRNRARLRTTNQQRFLFYGSSSWTSPTTVYTGTGTPISSADRITRGSYTEFTQDTVNAPATTSWTAKLATEVCALSPKAFYASNYTSYATLYPTGQAAYNANVNNPGPWAVQVSASSSKASCATQATTGYYPPTINWQGRRVYAYEYQSGYPRNDSTNTVVNSNMFTERTVVFNDSLGQEISPISSWYRVPPRTTIKVIKSVRTPVLTHYNDSAVAAGSFTSYSPLNLDLRTDWLVDTDLEITRAIDPGDVSLLPSVSQLTETFGNGIETYTVAR